MPLADIPMISMAPRLAEMKASPVTQVLQSLFHYELMIGCSM